MTRETRANVIFLCIFFALALPGIFMLTRKAYRGGGRDPAMRAPVHGEFAYMDPTPPAGITRIVPANTGDYIRGMADRLYTMQPGLIPTVLDKDHPPLMSDALNLQVIALGGSGGKYRVGLFGWNRHYAPLPQLYQLTGTRGGESVTGEMLEYEPQNLPMELRSELQDYGYVNPPDSVLWLIATFPGGAPLDSMQVKFHIDKTDLLDTIDFKQPAARPTTSALTQ